MSEIEERQMYGVRYTWKDKRYGIVTDPQQKDLFTTNIYMNFVWSLPDAISRTEEDVNISVAKANDNLVQLWMPVATNHTL